MNAYRSTTERPPENMRRRSSKHGTRFLAGLLCLLQISLIVAATGCAPSADTTERPQTVTYTRPLIGFSMDTLVMERWESDRNIFVSSVGELGGDVIVQNANSDSVEQKNQIRYLIKKNVDILVIVAIDDTVLADEITLAQEHDIPVIAYDRMINNPDIDLYISFDNQEVGRLMADALFEIVPGGEFAIMNGAIADRNCVQIRKGLQSVFDQHPDCQIVAENFADNWSADDAFAKFKTIISGQPDLDGILCSNDSLAGAAVRALAMFRKADKVQVTGQDADLDACQRIVEGRQLMTVYKPIGTIAKVAAQAAMTLAKGEKTESNDTVLVGTTSIPFIRLEPTAVNRDNMVAVIVDSGFHSLKDIFRNVPSASWPTSPASPTSAANPADSSAGTTGPS